MNFAQIYRDEGLWGHSLVSLTHKIWSFSKGEFCLYDCPDPGTLVVDKDYIVVRVIHYSKDKGRAYTSRTEIFLEKPLYNLIEFVGRRILGSCATITSFLTLSSIGFIAKIIHFSTRQVTIYITSTSLGQKIYRVWDNASLFGHALTSAPSKYYQFTTEPLGWHLRADGTDRRSYIGSRGPEGNWTVQESEYDFVPFEIFEFIYRRVIGGAITLVAGVVSPIGLVAKGVHLVSQSAFA